MRTRACSSPFPTSRLHQVGVTTAHASRIPQRRLFASNLLRSVQRTNTPVRRKSWAAAKSHRAKFRISIESLVSPNSPFSPTERRSFTAANRSGLAARHHSLATPVELLGIANLRSRQARCWGKHRAVLRDSLGIVASMAIFRVCRSHFGSSEHRPHDRPSNAASARLPSCAKAKRFSSTAEKARSAR